MSVKPDYKSPALHKKKRTVRHQGLVVALLAAVTLVGSLYGYVNKEKLLGDTKPAAAPPQPEAPKPAAAKPAPTTLPEAPKPKYDFYKVLPERQVVVPKGEITEHVPVPKTAPPPPDAKTAAKPTKPEQGPAVAKAKPEPMPAAKRRYVLQAGSYNNAAQADKLKASLAMLGVQARVEVVSAGGDRKLHRVRIGPFNDAKQAETMRKRLQSNNIQAVTIKLSD